MGQWNVDVNGYYSDVNAKYVTYDDKSNGLFFDDGKRALRNCLTIARILNRTLILSKFQCRDGPGGFCPLNSFMLIAPFTNHFDYRESEFLNHPLVPANISKPESVHKVLKETTTGWEKVDSLQILNSLGKIDSPVIHMGEISKDVNIIFKNNQIQTDFDNDVKNGMIPGKYKQM